MFFISNNLFAQKDSIKLKNSDILIGEIKSMDKSVLIFKTAYSDSDFKIKWLQLDEIYSKRYFVIELESGERISSTINSIPGKSGKINLDAGVNAFEEDLSEIVYMDPLGKNFLSRLKLAVDLGITLTKANNLRQVTSGFNGSYLANKWSSSGYFNLVYSRQDGIADVRRVDGSLDFIYHLKNDWFLQAEADYLGNDEQKLNLRSTYKFGTGYFFRRNNQMFFGAGSGLAYTIESYTDDTPSKNSSEFYAGLAFNKYDIGDLSLVSNIVYYLGISETGRQRVDLNFNMKYDLPYDFYIKASITYNFDSRPATGASKSDYVTQTSVGWEFN